LRVCEPVGDESAEAIALMHEGVDDIPLASSRACWPAEVVSVGVKEDVGR
jgi:hypothetical protein